MAAPAQGDETALGRALGFAPEEVDLLGEIFVEVLGKSGIEAGPIFEKLKRGASLGEAIAVPAGVPRLLYARAHQWFAGGRPDRAESLFRTLCLIEGSKPDNWVGWGICLRIADRLDQAALAFATAASLAPQWPIPPVHQAELAIRRGDWNGARLALDRLDALGEDRLPGELKVEVARFRSALALRTERNARG